MVTWLLGLRAFLSRAFGWIAKYPWPAACIALLIASLWLWHGKSEALSDLADEKRVRKADQAEWQRKVDAANQAVLKARTDAKESANDAQEYHEQLTKASDGLERYIADHRVQDKQCPRSSTPTGSGNPTPVPAEPASDSGVEVSAETLRTCDALYVYSASAYRWGQELKGKGLAVDGK